MTRTLTVEGDITTVDSRTLITTQGSVTAPSMICPTDKTKIDKIFVAAAADGAAAGSAVFFIRLGGAAVLGGEQVIVVSGAGVVAPQAGSDQAPEKPWALILENVDIAISPGEVITVAAEMAGSDLGTARICVTLVFA